MKFTDLFKRGVAALTLLSVTAAFFGVPYCDWACRIQPSTEYWFLGIVVLTFVWGRFFCEALCPLGIVQSIVNRLTHPKTPVRRVCSRLPESTAQIVVRWTVFVLFIGLIASGVGAAWAISPYAIYGKALAGGLSVTLIPFAIVVVLSAFGKGRVWCNRICPFGTLFHLLSRVSLRKQKIGPCCANCRACFAKSTYAKSKAEEAVPSSDGVTRRETLKGISVLAAIETADKLTDGGFAPISYHDEPKREHTVLPPGAISRKRFAQKCVGCDLCVANCPGECLKPSMSLSTFGQPVMTFAKGHCILGCTRCGDICPAGALEKLDDPTKANTHVGFAVWEKERCIRTTDGVPCEACIKKCPVKAIHDVNGKYLVVDREKCIGCGACEHVCAARPLPAMVVEGLDTQRIIRPMSEADLIAEMESQIAAGAAVVVARDNVIVRVEQGAGIRPVLDLLSRGDLKRALVVDKIIGRAAAAICIVGGAKKVIGQVMSEDAKALLEEHGVIAEGRTMVKGIVNRKGDGPCPMEEKVKALTVPEKMVEALRR